MKKLIMMLAFVSVSAAGMAQDEVPTEKYSVSTNSFWSNWFIQTNATWSSFYYGGASDLGSSPFYKFPMGTEVGKDEGHPSALGFSVALGKWFTPGLGLRTKANFAWLSKAFDSKSQTYLSLNEQVLFNLSNLICGYSETRVWNLIPFAGAGITRNFDEHNDVFDANIGILNTFRLGKKVDLNLELAYYSHDKALLANPNGDGVVAKNRFNQLALELGLTFKLGKATWNKTPDVEALKALSQSQIDALNAQLADEQAENARLKNLLANQKPVAETKTVTVKEVVAAPVSVFFNIGKSKIASRKDVQNVKELAEIAKANNSKIVVTGYADSKTGSASFNQKLSQKRAETVANELVKLGVSRDNIEVVAAGGVNTLTPVSYNRRATVAIK